MSDVKPERASVAAARGETPSIDELLKASRWDQRVEAARAEREKVLAARRARGETAAPLIKSRKPWTDSDGSPDPKPAGTAAEPIPLRQPSDAARPVTDRAAEEPSLDVLTGPIAGTNVVSLPTAIDLHPYARDLSAPMPGPEPARRSTAALVLAFLLGALLASGILFFAYGGGDWLTRLQPPAVEGEPPVGAAPRASPGVSKTLTAPATLDEAAIPSPSRTAPTDGAALAAIAPTIELLAPDLSPTALIAPEAMEVPSADGLVLVAFGSGPADTIGRVPPFFPKLVGASLPGHSGTRPLTLAPEQGNPPSFSALGAVIPGPLARTSDMARSPHAPGAPPSVIALPVTGAATSQPDAFDDAFLIADLPLVLRDIAPVGPAAFRPVPTAPGAPSLLPAAAEPSAPVVSGPATPPVQTIAEPAPARAPARADIVTVHLLMPEVTDGGLAESISGAVSALGYETRDPAPVPITISESQVRYFHPEDAADARTIAAAANLPARDFTGYRPSPLVGTMEVWFEGEAANADP